MKDITKYISIIAVIVGLYSCSLKEEFMPVNRKTSVEFVARLTGFNNVDITTKSAPTEEFETAVYTAYFLLFDSSTGARIAVDSVDVSSGSLSQTIVGKMPGPVTACFIANIPQGFAAKNLTSLTALNSAVLDITYATYSEAGGYLGVPKLTVNGETKLCIPMFGSKNISNITNGENIEIPVKRMFAKITVELKLSMKLSGFQSAIQNLTNYELSYYNLHDLPNKVRLVEDKSESPWKDGSGNPATFQSANVDAKIYNSTSSMEQKSYAFDCYVPEFYLNPKQNPTNDQRYKPVNKADGTFPIYLELVGQYNAYSITSTDINYKVYLGNDNVSDFSLARNTHYKNVLTIKGTNQNSTTPDNLDHRVTTSTINNPVAKAGKAANCYVINATGEYNFPAYKGAYNDLTKAVLCNNQTANELVILANDNSSNIELKDYIYDPERNLISFNVSKIANGNVVLGLNNRDGSLEWSWHLWFNREYDAGALGQWAQINTQTMPDGTTKMIDRNLGASPSTLENLTAGAVDGNYYKYGHRAPYFTDSVNGAAYHGYEEGDYSSWNTTDKSHTDPCPPGYRVPNSSVWASSKQDHMDFGSYYFTYKKRSVSIVGGVEVDLVAINYPYSGRVTPSLSIESEAYMLDNTTTSGTITSTISDWSGRYRNIVYSLDLNYMFSALHGADNMLLYGYCDISDNMKITQYQYYTIAWWSTYSEGDWDFAPDVVKALAKDQIEEKLADYVGAYIIKAPDTSHGYQVRCVSETSIKSN